MFAKCVYVLLGTALVLFGGLYLWEYWVGCSRCRRNLLWQDRLQGYRC